MVLIFVGGGFVFGEDGPLSNVGEALFGWIDALGPESLVLAVVAAFAASLALCAISAVVSMRFYATREF